MLRLLDVLGVAGRIHSIDATRAVAMGFIVAIHANTLRGLGTAGDAAYFLIDATGRFAVPFFFLTAGYLYARKQAESDAGDYAWTYCKRVGSIYAGALLLYGPLVLLVAAGGAVQAGSDVRAAVLASAAEALSPAGLLYYGDSVLLVLWFLPALVLSIGLVYAFVELGLERYLLPVALGLHVVGILGETGLLVDVPVETRDAAFFGFFFTSVGYRLRSSGWSPSRDRSSLYLALAGALAVANLGERYLLGYVLTGATLTQGIYVPDYTVASALFSIACFVFVLSRPELGRSTVLSTIGRYAVYVYVLHPLILFGLVGVGRASATIGSDPVPTLVWHLVVFPVSYLGALGLYVGARRVADRGTHSGSDADSTTSAKAG